MKEDNFNETPFFSFIRYLNPIWQFNLLPQVNGAFPSCYIRIDEKHSYKLDNNYKQESSMLYDCGFKLWYKGYLLESRPEDIAMYATLPKPTLQDEYTFIKKYWGTKWSILILCIRFFLLKNIFKELPACMASLKIKTENLFSTPLSFDEYDSFDSPLIKQNPLVSVIIPTLNRYDLLADTLSDLEHQDYKNFEVVIIDQSDDFNEDFYKQFQLNISLFNQKEKLLWTARNKAIMLAKSDFFLFFDDDSRIEKNWISEHLKCLDFFKAQISAGVSIAVAGGKVSLSYNYFRWADQFDSGNAMVHKDVFYKTGLFDEKFNNGRMGDGEFGIRAYLHGIRSISNCKAYRVHLKAPKGGLRETVSWDAFRPKKIFSPKPVPSVLYLVKKYFPKAKRRHYIFQGIMFSNVGYKHKRSQFMMVFSIALLILKWPLLFYQYKISSRLANSLLQKPEQIPSL